MTRPLGLLALGASTLALAACGSGVSATGKPRLVAAESSWGTIAAQIAGVRVGVRSIVSDPNQDPHAYEPRAGDARAFATARLVILNGLGYDSWARRLLAANPVPGRDVIDVGARLGLAGAANPHRWYDPADVLRIARALAAELARVDPAGTSYYAERERSFETRALAGYRALIAAIRGRFAGTSVGASESIFSLLAPALGLRVLTPASFTNAVSEGVDPPGVAVALAQRQISSGAVRLWVYNSQNATPDVQRLSALARARGIPVVTITETPSPDGTQFAVWQTRQLAAIEHALQSTPRR